MIRPQELRYSIDIQRLSGITDQYGSVNETYTTIFQLKTGIKKENQNYSINNSEKFHNNIITFICYKRDIQETDRIVYNSKNYRILSINEIDFNFSLEITVELIND
jgi:head-tail adaptor